MDLNEVTKLVKSKASLSKDITVAGIKFGIATLSSADTIEVVKLVEKFRDNTDDIEKLSHDLDYMKRVTVAYSIVRINDEEVPEEFEVPNESGGPSEMLPKHVVLADKLSEWPEDVTEIIYRAVNDLRKESRKKISDMTSYEWFEEPNLLEEDPDGMLDFTDTEELETVELKPIDEKASDDIEKANSQES
jgi:hypothetical protein